MNNTELVDKVVQLMYNESPYKVFDLVYGEEHHISYKSEKINSMKDFIRFWGSLDSDHKERLVKVAIDRSR